MTLRGALQNTLIIGCLCLHVWYTPYTKVEESFNLHAAHDILFYGISPKALAHYDHFKFPGVVPRSFIGSLLLSALVKPWLVLASRMGLLTSKEQVQLLVRLTLATLNGVGLCFLRSATASRFSEAAGQIFTLLTLCQYHIPFWAGRTLPNMFALVPVNMSFYQLIRNDHRSFLKSIGLLTVTAVILRAELVLLLAPLCLQLLHAQRTTPTSLMWTGLAYGFSALAATIIIDSYFWNTWPTFPEFNGIVFNVLQGKSAEWGVSPAHTYVTSFLPKLLAGALPLSVLGALCDRRIRRLLLPCLAFIGLISGLGHKEWRFIVYVIPIFNIAAARGSAFAINSSRNRHIKFAIRVIITALITATFLATAMFTQVSHLNYPGGETLHAFHELVLPKSRPVHLYIDNLAAQTGASLFLQSHSDPFVGYSPPLPWIYNKTERISEFSNFTHVITENPSQLTDLSQGSEISAQTLIVKSITPRLVRSISVGGIKNLWRPIACTFAFTGWSREHAADSWRRFFLLPKVETKLWILERQLPTPPPL